MASLKDLESRLRNLFNQGSQTVGRVLQSPIGKAYSSVGQAAVNTVAPGLNLVQQAVKTPQFQNAFRSSFNQVRSQIPQSVPATQRLQSVAGLTNPTQLPFSIIQGGIQNAQKYAQRPQNVFSDALQSGKLAASLYGAGKVNPQTLGVSGFIGGALNKVGGGSFSEGFGTGVATAPQLAGIGRVTNPLINQYAGQFANKFTNPLTKQLSSRLATGALNVPEGAIMDSAIGQQTTPQSAALDFALGAITGRTGTGNRINPKSPGLSMAKNQYKYLETKDRQDISDILEDLMFKSEDITYRMNRRPNDEKILREYAEKYIGKEFAFGTKRQGKSTTYKTPIQNVAQELLNRVRGEQGMPEMGVDFPAFVDTRSRGIGSFTNVPEIDNRLYKGNVPPPSKSVLDEIQTGFAKGRKEREVTSQKGIGLTARTELIDRLSPVYDFVKQAGKDLPAEKNPYKKMRLLAGVSGKVETFVDQNVAPILKREQKRLNDLSSLLVLERERELIGRGLVRKRSLLQVDQGVAELKSKYGEEGFNTLQQSANEIRSIGTNLMDQLKESGIIDEASYNNIRKNNEFYAPFEAVEHLADNLEKGHGTGSFNVASQDVVKKIGDYTGDVADPIEAFVRKIPKVLALVEKNKAIQSFVDLRKQYPDIYGELITPARGDRSTPGMGSVNVFENGKNVKYEVPDVVESAIKNLDAESAGILVSIGSIQAKILRTGATGLNIGFIPANIIRDIQDALTTEFSEKGAKAMFKFLASYPRAIFSAARKDDLYKQWAQSGGLQSTMTEQIFNRTPKTVIELSGKKGLYKSIINSPKQLIEFANRVGEQSTRLARFQSGIKSGESLEEAAFKSRDISLDFAKAGNKVKVLNQVIPFLNAGIQGSEKLLRLYKTNPARATLATTLLFGVPTVGLYVHNSQFKDYDDIPDAEKQNYWIILARDRTDQEIADGEKVIGIKIPKGFLGRMVANTSEAGMEFMRKKDPSTFATSAIDSLAGISPVGIPYNKEQLGQTISTVLPPWLQAGAEAVTNTNLYFGTSIVPQSLKNLPPSEQYRENTPNIYKIGGKMTGISPLILENTVGTTTGGVGRQIASLLSGDLKGATVDQVTRRFSGIRGGKKADEAYAFVEKEKQYTALRNKQLKEAFKSGNTEEFYRLAEGMSSQQIKTLLKNDIKKEAKSSLTPEQRAYQSLTKEEQRRILRERPELETKIKLLPEASAAEESSFQTNIQDSIEESLVKTQVEISGEPQVFNNKYYYINENGNGASIDMDFNVEKPSLTGQELLDKKLKSAYQGDITTKQNNVVKLFEMQVLTAEQAQQELGKLELARKTLGGGGGGGGKGRKGKAISVKRISPVKVSFSPLRRRSLNTIKLSKAPLRTKAPKVKTLKIKAPEAKRSYNIVGPSQIKGLTNSVRLV